MAHFMIFHLPCAALGTELVSHYLITRSPSGHPAGRYCGETVTVSADAVSFVLCLTTEYELAIQFQSAVIFKCVT